MSDKQLRIYEPIWVALKKHGELSIQLKKEAMLSDNKQLVKTIKKAVSKEKYMDTSFRAKHPAVRLQLKYNKDNQVLNLSLVDYFILDMEEM